MPTSTPQTTIAANTSSPFSTATPAGSTSQAEQSFWQLYHLYLLSGGAALLVAIAIILCLCRHRRRQRAKRRLPSTNLEAAPLDDALPLDTLSPGRGVIDSSPTHLQPTAVAAAPGAAFAHDVVPLTLAEDDTDSLEAPVLKTVTSTTAVMDQWAPAHDQGYVRPSSELEELRTAVANNSSITLINDTSIKVSVTPIVRISTGSLLLGLIPSRSRSSPT
jgi:hypothetical protein